MKLQDKIKNDLKIAILNNKDNKSFLRVIIGEMDRIGKDLDDNQIILILKKMRENALIMDNNKEIEIIDNYLPKMLSETEIKGLVSKIIKENNFSTLKDMGKTMQILKKLDEFPLIDGKIASTFARELLS